ncbi:MAG: heparinase II/III family protein [Candidatus Manganitrophus sp. SA1]|nr:heparinase II/III family protein [Candidatus Manganitrophus morganii]
MTYRENQVPAKKGIGFFRRSQCFETPEQVLTYYRARTEIDYFPVADENETAREKIDDILRNLFEFNHESHPLPDPIDWKTNPSRDVEWLILLHKFYYAVGLGMAYRETQDPRYAEKWMALTSSWIDSVALDFLPSDVAGRRIQNWIFAHYYFVTSGPTPAVSPDFYVKFLESIYRQVNHLCEHLTPARNHRTLELYAIFLAAVVFPEMKGAEEWLAISKSELLKNIQTDLLPDGVHCELSTDYHHLVLKNYLGIRKLAALNGIGMPGEFDSLIQKALTFSLYVHKPDGFIPSLSDGDVRSFLDLLAQGYRLYGSEELLYAVSKGKGGRPPALRSKGFPAAGYYILRSGRGNGAEPYEDERYLVFDCGPLGEGNHGHLDLLSIEVAAYGRSLIVDPGRYTYDESGETNWRARFRGTAYHNTVMVDGKNQTAYRFDKKRFKIKGPPPDREMKRFIFGRGFDYLHGIARSHEYEAVHERKVFFACPEYWIVSDHLIAQQPHDYDLLFHLSDEAHEKVSVSVKSDTLLVNSPYLVVAQALDPEIKLQVEEGYLSRSYGVKHPAPVLRFMRHGTNVSYHTVLYPYKDQAPGISVEALSVTDGSGGHCSEGASAFCITVTRNGERFCDYYFTARNEIGSNYLFDDLQYNGTFAFVRQDSDGKIIRTHAEPNRILSISGKTISPEDHQR